MDIIDLIRQTKISEILKLKEIKNNLHFVSENDSLGLIVKLMQTYSISQMPVIQDNKITGSIDENTLLEALSKNISLKCFQVKDIMKPPMSVIDIEDSAEKAFELLLNGHSAVIISSGKRYVDIIGRIDFLNYFIINYGDFEYVKCEFSFNI